ncbi:glycoside hydrolase [Podospora australis]|uniref:Glycoside hydrolase n=1 Tax=Podospora australis TaxID=1536484 RepID=A0AAN7AM67_9PEZI|nr:glycoside hydrolase [Podospora australis]
MGGPLPTFPAVVIPSAVQAAIPNLLRQLTAAAATQTQLVPGLLGAIDGLLTPQHGGGQDGIPVPTGAPAPLPSLLSQIGNAVTAESSRVPRLLSQLSGLLTAAPSDIFPVTTITPTIVVPALPRIPTTIATASRQPFINLGPVSSREIAALPSAVGAQLRSYLFNPRSSANIAVYYGQSEASTRFSLADTCADPNVDIVVLGFITAIQADGSYFPRLQLSPIIPGFRTPSMVLNAPGLAYYATLEAQIKRCQTQYGKKVLLSLGGAGHDLLLRSDQEAVTFANRLWSLFGPVGAISDDLRPFGSAVIDGIDLAKSDGFPSFWGTFATAIRANFASDLSKEYFLSAAPGCAFPDRSIPNSFLAQCNYVWPEFFNNPACEIGSDGFYDSLLQWSRVLADGIVPLRDSSAFRTRMYVGIPAWREAAPAAYNDLGGAKGARTLASQLKSVGGLSNIGGLMIWDGPEGLDNVREGLSIIAWAKSGLRG